MNTKKVNNVRALGVLHVIRASPTAHDNVRPAVAEQSVRFDAAVPTLPNHCHHFHVKHKRVLEEETGK